MLCNVEGLNWVHEKEILHFYWCNDSLALDSTSSSRVYKEIKLGCDFARNTVQCPISFLRKESEVQTG